MKLTFEVTEELAGRRLDVALADAGRELSRAQARRLIERGHVSVAGRAAKGAYRLRLGEKVVCTLPAPVPAAIILPGCGSKVSS